MKEKKSQFHRVSIAMSAMLLCQRVIPEIRWWTPPPSQGTRPQWWGPLPWPHVHGSGCSGTRPGPKSMWNKEVDVVDVNWGGSKDHLSIFCCQYNAILTTHFPGNGLLSLLFYYQKCWWRGTVYCFTHITKLCETLVFGLKMRFGMWLLVEDYVNIYMYIYIYIYLGVSINSGMDRSAVIRTMDRECLRKVPDPYPFVRAHHSKQIVLILLLSPTCYYFSSCYCCC